jgi:hypothetical protein
MASAVDRHRTISGRPAAARESVQIGSWRLKEPTIRPINPTVGPLRRVAITASTLLAAASLAACGEEERAATPPALSSPKVAMTVTYPGYAPFALITYRDGQGRRCHGIGSVTPNGPRVMGALGISLADGLARRGKCLGAADSDVSLQVRKVGPGAPRVVGGIVRDGVTKVVVAGQRVDPRPTGEFLVVQPAGAGALGSEVELEYRAGQARRLPLARVSS